MDVKYPVMYDLSFTHLRGFESSVRPIPNHHLRGVLPTYVGLNPRHRSSPPRSRRVLPTYVGLNLDRGGSGCGTIPVLPTYVGLNPGGRRRAAVKR